MSRARRVPIVIIPGIAGSELLHRDEPFWPVDDLSDLVDLERLLTCHARVGRFLPDYGTHVKTSGWAGMLSLLTGPDWGYVEDRDLFLFTYDWRAPVKSSAERLRDRIERWARDLDERSEPGASQPQQFLLIAHSHGTLLSRWYLEKLGGTPRVAQLFMMASIEQGAPFMLGSLLLGRLKMPKGSVSWLIELAASLGQRRVLRVIKDAPGLYQWTRMEGVVETPDGPAPPERLGFDDEEDRALWRSGGELLDALMGTPPVPSTYVYGTGYPTPASYFLHNGDDLSELETHYAAGDGVVLARSARAVDIRAGIDVKAPIRAHHLELISHPETLAALEALLGQRAGRNPSSLSARWWEHLTQDPALRRASEQSLPMVVAIPSIEAIISPLEPEITGLHARGALLLLGEEALAATPVLLGWLTYGLRAEPLSVLPIRLDIGEPGLPDEPEEMLVEALRRAMEASLGRSPEESALRGLMEGRLVALVTGLERALERLGRQALSACLDQWRKAFPLASWVLIDPARRCATIFRDVGVRACLDVQREIRLSCRASSHDDALSLEIGVGEPPGHLRGGDGLVSARPMPASWLLDPRTGQLRQPRFELSFFSQDFKVEGSPTSVVSVGVENRYSTVHFKLRRTRPEAREAEVRLSSNGVIVHQIPLDLLDILDGGLIDRRWTRRVLDAMVRADLVRDDALDRLDEATGLARGQSADPRARILARLDGFLAETPRRDGAVLMLTWLEHARRALREREEPFEDRWVLDQACDYLRELLGVPTVTLRRMLQMIVDEDDLLPCAFLRGATDSVRAVGRVKAAYLRGGVSESQASGTGWLVTPDLLMTCRHVVAPTRLDADTSAEDEVAPTLVAEVTFDLDGPGAQGTTVPIQEIVAHDPGLDFALLRLAEPQPERPLPPWSKREVVIAPGTALYLNIVQHPNGSHKRIALRGNKARSATTEEIRYSTDTEPGSSGAPVCNDRWEVVALHQIARSYENTSFNVGIQLSAIREHLKREHLAVWREIQKHHP